MFTRLERSIAQRVISGYRTVSSNAALFLARLPPTRFLAPMRKRVYVGIKRLIQSGELSKETKEELMEQEFLAMACIFGTPKHFGRIYKNGNSSQARKMVNA